MTPRELEIAMGLAVLWPECRDPCAFIREGQTVEEHNTKWSDVGQPELDPCYACEGRGWHPSPYLQDYLAAAAAEDRWPEMSLHLHPYGISVSVYRFIEDAGVEGKGGTVCERILDALLQAAKGEAA